MTSEEFRRKMTAKTSKPRTNANTATKEILAFLAVSGFKAWRNNTTGVYDPKKQIFRKFAGLKGVADILGLQKSTGRFLAVEVKVGKDKLSPEQIRFLEDVKKGGGIAIVASCAGDVAKALEKI